MKLLKLLTLFVLFLVPIIITTHAQDSSSKSTLISTLSDTLQIAEQKALVAESHGNYTEAIDTLTHAFLTLLKEYQTKDVKEQGIIAGISEAYLHKLVNLSSQNYQFTNTVKLLNVAESYNITPDFNAWVKYYLGELYLKTNAIVKAREKYQELGFINDWQIIGPFDNENGVGFNTSYPPEAEINLDTVYDGKKMPVAWRHITLDSILGGYIKLKDFLRPNNNAVAYALSYVFSDKVQPVVFRIASDESIKLWLNQTIVHSNDIQRKACTIDQDIFGCTLKEGWNQIMLKVTNTRDHWGFRLRITDLRGDLIKGLKYEAKTEKIKKLSTVKSTQTEQVPLNPDGLSLLEETVRENTNNPNYYFYIGLIKQGRADFDYQKPLDRSAFQNALSDSVNFPYYQYYFAQSLREKTSSLTEQEENQYRTNLETVIKLIPDHLLALTDLAEYYLNSLRNKTKSRVYLNRVLNVKPDFTSAINIEIKLLKEEKFTIESSLRIKLLADKNPSYLPAQLDYAQELVNKHRLTEAITIYQHILRNIDYTNQIARDGIINILIRQNKIKEALQLYEVALILEPNRIEFYLARAKIMESQDDYEASLKEIQKSLKICPEDYSILTLQGEYLAQLNHLDEASQIWQKVLRINPNYLSLQRYLEWLENTGESFETSFREDIDTILDKTKEIPKPSLEFSAYYLLNQVVTKINKDGTSRQYYHQIIHVLNEKGLRDFQQIRISYNPESQKVKVLSSRVIYRDGRHLDTPYTGGEFINLPPLEINAVIDIEYRLDDIQQGFFGDYFGDKFYFGSSNPTYKSSYIIIAERNKPLYFNLKNIKLEPKITNDDKQTTYIWETFNISGFSPEPMMPPLSEVVPVLQVSTYKDWKEFGKWYWHLIKRQYDITEEMRQFLLQYVVHPLMNNEEKINAVYNFIIGTIRYVAWEYGIHGWKPYRASTIFARRFGDCKDKTTLINVFLNELNIKSYPVLIYAEDIKGEDDLTLPMVEHFNHCITYVVLNNGKEFWLDGTAVFNRMGLLPAEDTNAKVFVINEEGGEIKQISPNQPADNGRREKNIIRVNLKGNTRLETEVTFIGEQATNLRYLLFNPSKRNLVIERMFSLRYGGTQITSLETDGLERLDTPVGLTVTASIPNFLAKQQKNFIFKPVIFPQELSSLITQSERKFDLLLPRRQYPYEDNIQTEFIMPFNTQVKSIPENIDLNNKFGSFMLHYQVENDRIIFTEKVSLNTQRINKEDYKAFRDFCNLIMREEDREIIITSK